MAENNDQKRTKTCKYCKTEIPADAKICPNCKKRQRPGECLIVVAVVVILVVLAAVFGGNSEPQAIPAATSGPEDGGSVQSEEQAPTETVFSVGETAELNGVQVTLQSVEENPGEEYVQPADGNVFVALSFEINNGSDQDLAVSSMASFEAYCDDYSLNESLTGETLYQEGGSLNGTVAAGKKMSGTIVYEIPADWSKLEVSFSPSVWADEKIPFVIENQ